MNAHLRPLSHGAILVFALVVFPGCASEPELVFADWLLPVPEGTPVKEHAAVPLDERDAATIELIDDLVLGTDLSNPAAVLYEPRGIAVTESGDIFVADGGSEDIKMFDAEGNYLKTLGKEGQGPGEFGSILGLTLAGNRLIVNDNRNARLSVWTLDGEHVADYAPEERRFLSFMTGLADGTLLGSTRERDADRTGRVVVLRQNVQGEELSRLLELPLPAPTIPGSRDRQAIFQGALDSFDAPRILVGGSEEAAYVTPMHEYQVFAYAPEGEMLWALRTAWQRSPWNDDAKSAMLRSFEMAGIGGGENQQPLQAEAFTWPELYTALSGVLTDGRGRIFAFIAPLPSADNDGIQPPREWPVDVYTPDGDFIAAGVVPNRWSYARGDYVYGTRPDDNDETVVVRYRLLVNGQ